MYDESQPEPLTEQDSPNHTKFFTSDAETRRLDGSESHESWYSRLALYNDGVTTGQQSNRELRHQQDDLAVYDAVVGSLECTPHQKRRGRHLFDELSLREFVSPNGIDVALVALCVAAHVVREDGRVYHPSRGADCNDKLFRAFIDDHEYDDRHIHKCYAKVGDRLEVK